MQECRASGQRKCQAECRAFCQAVCQARCLNIPSDICGSQKKESFGKKKQRAIVKSQLCTRLIVSLVDVRDLRKSHWSPDSKKTLPAMKETSQEYRYRIWKV